jgi:hypothetical protein
VYQRILALLTGQSLKLKPPVATVEGRWSASEKMSVQNFWYGANWLTRNSEKRFKATFEKYQVDEFIFTCDIYDTQKTPRQL